MLLLQPKTIGLLAIAAVGIGLFALAERPSDTAGKGPEQRFVTLPEDGRASSPAGAVTATSGPLAADVAQPAPTGVAAPVAAPTEDPYAG